MAMAGGEIAARAVAFVAVAYLTRQLGPAGFGLVGFATAFTAYFGLIVTSGITRIGAREVARRPADAATLAASVVLLRLVIAAFSFIALWALVGRMALEAETRTIIRLSALTLFTLALDVSWVYKGIERGGRIAGAAVAAQAVMLLTVLVLVRAPSDARWVPIAQVAGDCTMAVLLLGPLVMRVRHLAMPAALALLRAARIPAITNVLRVLVLSFDIVLLGLLGKRADVGYYTAAYRVCFLVLGIQVALYAAYVAAAARAEGAAALGRVVSRSLALACAVSLPLLVGGILLAEPLMSLLFGPAFAVGAPLLQWLLVSMGFALGHAAFSGALLASGATSRELAITAVGALVNVSANLLVIPTYGARGAAMVTAASEGVALLLFISAGRRAGWGVRVGGIVPSLAATAVMAVALLLVGPGAHVLVRIGMAATVYAVALIVVGVPPEAQPFVTAVKRAIWSAVHQRHA